MRFALVSVLVSLFSLSANSVETGNSTAEAVASIYFLKQMWLTKQSSLSMKLLMLLEKTYHQNNLKLFPRVKESAQIA